jgi:hypothetical protein
MIRKPFSPVHGLSQIRFWCFPGQDRVQGRRPVFEVALLVLNGIPGTRVPSSARGMTW